MQKEFAQAVQETLGIATLSVQHSPIIGSMLYSPTAEERLRMQKLPNLEQLKGKILIVSSKISSNHEENVRASAITVVSLIH